MLKITSVVAAGAAATVLFGCASGTGAHNTPSSKSVAPTSTATVVLNAKFGQTYPVVASTQPAPETCTVTVGAPQAAKSLPLAYSTLSPDHGWFVTFTVTFKATSENVTPGGQYAFEVRTADGSRYGLLAGQGASDTLPNSTLHNGEMMSGTMTADVPSPHGTLTYSMAYEAGPTQIEWPF